MFIDPAGNPERSSAHTGQCGQYQPADGAMYRARMVQLCVARLVFPEPTWAAGLTGTGQHPCAGVR